MTFWDFCHAHVWLTVAAGLVGLLVAGLAFVAFEDSLVTRREVERLRAVGRRDKS